MKIDTNNWFVSCYLVATYMCLWCMDLIDYYHAKMILHLPAYMFGHPILRIQQDPESGSDSDTDEDPIEFDVFVSRLIFVFDGADKMQHRVMHGAQLRPLIIKDRFYIGRLLTFFPSLDSIVMTYAKVPTISSNYDTGEITTKVIDVKKRYDIRGCKSCKMGVVF